MPTPSLFASQRVTCRVFVFLLIFVATHVATGQSSDSGSGIDQQLRQMLDRAGFTGRVQSTLEARLHRKIDPRLPTSAACFSSTLSAGARRQHCAGQQYLCLLIPDSVPSGIPLLNFENCQ